MRRIAMALVAAMALATGSCVQQRAVSGPEGRLSVLPENAAIEDTWRIDGAAHGQYGTEEMFGKRALYLINGRDGYRLFRQTKATLLSSPYLTWEWYLRPFLHTQHPVRLLIGFHGGAAKSGSWGSELFSNLSGSLPPYDRRLYIGWAASPADKGRVFVKGDTAFYVLGGGPEGINRWRSEVADLSAVYARAWPQDDPTRVQIMFIGLDVEEGQTATRGHITNLLLTR